MTNFGRRGFFKLLAGLLASRWMPAPLRRAPAINLDAINQITADVMLPEIADNFFLQAPLLAMLKEKTAMHWTGSPIQENFLYTPPNRRG